MYCIRNNLYENCPGARPKGPSDRAPSARSRRPGGRREEGGVVGEP